MRILVAEDEPRISRFIARGLTASDVAYRILGRRLVLDLDDWHDTGGAT